MSVVVDASVALDWVFKSERTAYANRVLEQVSRDGAIVPAIFPAEVANGLLTAMRSRRIVQEDTPVALSLFEPLQLVVHHPPFPDALRRLILTGITSGLTAYDAAYLELAIRESLPLAAHDEALKKAASKAGVALFERGTRR